MEHRNPIFHYDQSKISSPGSNPLVESEWFSEEQKQEVVQPAATEPPKFPISCVQRLMRKVRPGYAKVAEESKAMIADCVTEFISFITMEANQHCKEELRKTITAEDLIFAMAKLGFNPHAEILTLYLHRYRQFNQEQEGGTSTRVPHRAGASAGSSLVPIIPRAANDVMVNVMPPPPPPPTVPNPSFETQNPIGTLGGIDVVIDNGLTGGIGDGSIGGGGFYDDGSSDAAADDVSNDPIGYFNRQTSFGGN